MTNPFSSIWSRLFPPVEPWVIDLCADLEEQRVNLFSVAYNGDGIITLTRLDCKHLVQIEFCMLDELVTVYSAGHPVDLNRREQRRLDRSMLVWRDSKWGNGAFTRQYMAWAWQELSR